MLSKSSAAVYVTPLSSRHTNPLVDVCVLVNVCMEVFVLVCPSLLCPSLLCPSPVQVGTWAGNLMLTHNNSDFPSDVYTIMEAVGAKVTIATSATASKSYSLQEFLSIAMTTSVIVSMEIPFLVTNEQFKSFKVMPRAQVCVCIVCAGAGWACSASFW